MFYIICSFKTLEEGVGESLDLENKKQQQTQTTQRSYLGIF